MKVLTPEPINRQRALNGDTAYFAKMYLNFDLSEYQIKAVDGVVFEGKNMQLGGMRTAARQQVFRTIVVLAKMKGMRVNVVEKEEPIDV